MMMTRFEADGSSYKPSFTHTQQADSDVISLVLGGDAKAFRQLVNRYLPIVYNHLYHLTQNHELSEEMSQEAFVKAYSHLKSFDRSRRFKPWILRIASNATMSELRKNKKVLSLNALEEEGYWGEEQHQQEDDPLLRLERKLSSESVLKILDRMDPRYRQVLLLRYQNELSYDEIAKALDVPLNTVRTRIKRGISQLKTEVKESM